MKHLFKIRFRFECKIGLLQIARFQKHINPEGKIERVIVVNDPWTYKSTQLSYK